MEKYLYSIILNITNGKIHAITNKRIPITNLYFLLSIIPPAIKRIPKKPKITGSIWEMNVVPTTAILSHNNL